MTFLEISSGRIAYDEQGSGETIVTLPSGAHNRHDYDELRALMPAGYRTIALDWPAHGDSPPDAGPGSAMHLADVAEEAVAQLAPNGAIVLGNSVGGFAATRVAIRRPELVKALVIIDGGGFAGRPPHVRAFCALMAKQWFLRAIYPIFSRQYMRARTDADRRVRDAAIATTRRPDGLRAISELWRSFASPEHDLRREAHAITAPTLLIWGKRDPVIPARFARGAARTIEGSELVVLDTGHLPHTSDPQGFAAHLLPFLERALPARRASQAA